MPNPTREELNAEIAALQARETTEKNVQHVPQQSNVPADPMNQQQQQIPAPTRADREEVPVQVPDTLQAPQVPEITPIAPETDNAQNKPVPEADAKNDDPRKNDPKYWEQRLKTVEGMQRKREEQFEQQLQQQQQMIELLKRQTEAAIPQEKAPEMPTNPVDITEKMLIERYGEDDIENYGTTILARELANENRIAQLQKQVETLVQTTQTKEQQTAAERAEQAFWETVGQTVPDAARINKFDQGWADYLDQGYRREMLSAAMARGDHTTIASEMLAYQQQKKQQQPGMDPSRPSLPSIEEQAQPQVSAAGQQGQPRKKPVYTQSQVTQFYDERTRGRLAEKWSPDQIKQMERQIHTAVHEGRVVPG